MTPPSRVFPSNATVLSLIPGSIPHRDDTDPRLTDVDRARPDEVAYSTTALARRCAIRFAFTGVPHSS